ncbi:MAG: DUF4294 domain-containing protein [Rikenellaceae bacterium]|nr:DUF4294 domain-containing protein [Rikenellaceae bacterium]
MKRPLLYILIILALPSAALAQRKDRHGKYIARLSVEGGDTIQVIDLLPVYKFKRPIDARRHEKLIRNVKLVYPIAREARRRLEQMEEEMLSFPTPKEQREYMRRMEKEIKEEYEPVLRKMTLSQGKILIKLIDRETSNTSYELVKELRGGFRAVFWQGIARIFGANLKDGYDKDGEDRLIEQIILLYEAGYF